MFRNTKIDGNEKEKKTIEIEEEEGKRRNNKQERRKIQFQERGTTQQSKVWGEAKLCEKRRVVIGFGNLQKGEETKSQRPYMRCPELNGIRGQSPKPHLTFKDLAFP